MKPKKPIESLIFNLRQQKVILDADLAELYGVPTRRLNEQIKRNADRFTPDFLFQLITREWEDLKSQIATSSLATRNSHGGRRKLPHAAAKYFPAMPAMTKLPRTSPTIHPISRLALVCLRAGVGLR